MSTAIIVVILVFICIFSIKSYAKKLANGCCGGGDVEKKIKVKNKNKADYPFCVEIAVDGMTCGHCKMRVENVLNSQNGVWAEVDLKKKSVTVRMKERISDEELKKIITKEGYSVGDIISK